MRYFDSRDGELTVKHIMASGALPPAFPGRPHRRRVVLGRRHSVEHADRGGVRRQSAQELADLRRSHVESVGSRADHDGGGAEPAQGRAVFEPDREPHRATAAGASAAPRHQPARSPDTRRPSATARRFVNWPAMAVRHGCMWCGCWRRNSIARTTPRTSTSVRPASAALGRRLCPHPGGARSLALGRRVRSALGRYSSRADGDHAGRGGVSFGTAVQEDNALR